MNNERLTIMTSNGDIYPKYSSEVGWKECMKKLYEYEILEEQGLLTRRPCKIGDTVWFIGTKCEKCEEDCCFGCDYNIYGEKKDERFVYSMTVKQFIETKDTIECLNSELRYSSSEISLNLNELGKTVFFSKEEAEEKLKNLK